MINKYHVIDDPITWQSFVQQSLLIKNVLFSFRLFISYSPYYPKNKKSVSTNVKNQNIILISYIRNKFSRFRESKYQFLQAWNIFHDLFYKGAYENLKLRRDFKKSIKFTFIDPFYKDMGGCKN